MNPFHLEHHECTPAFQMMIPDASPMDCGSKF
jgi:hypothetical protein